MDLPSALFDQRHADVRSLEAERRYEALVRQRPEHDACLRMVTAFNEKFGPDAYEARLLKRPLGWAATKAEGALAVEHCVHVMWKFWTTAQIFASGAGPSDRDQVQALKRVYAEYTKQVTPICKGDPDCMRLFYAKV